MNKHKNYNPSHYIAGSEAVVFFFSILFVWFIRPTQRESKNDLAKKKINVKIEELGTLKCSVQLVQTRLEKLHRFGRADTVQFSS